MAIAGGATTAYRCSMIASVLETTTTSHLKEYCTKPADAAQLLRAGKVTFVAASDMTELRGLLSTELTQPLPTPKPTATGSGYWPDHRLLAWAKNGGITPFDADKFNTSLSVAGRLINPASVDLTLGNTVRRVRTYETPLILDFNDKSPSTADMAWHPIQTFDELMFYPGECILLSTAENVTIPTGAISFLYLKSSTGRKAIEQLHAGLGDPGFPGELTLEVINHSGVIWRLHPGDRLVQLVLADLSSEPTNSYTQTGRYVGQQGATAWRSA